MEKFLKIEGIAAPMPLINIDTDMIIPKQFLKTIKRSGLGKNLFDEMRFNDDGTENPTFVLNQVFFLKTTRRFHCGSVVYHASWAYNFLKFFQQGFS